MIIVKNLTPIVKYESLKLENHFYEMLTATVSHDMRTPLNAMIGLINNLQLFVSNEEAQKFLQIIKNSSKFMCFLVNDLLDFFQIRNGKFRKNMEWVDVDKCVREIVDLFKVGAGKIYNKSNTHFQRKKELQQFYRLLQIYRICFALMSKD